MIHRDDIARDSLWCLAIFPLGFDEKTKLNNEEEEEVIQPAFVNHSRIWWRAWNFLE